MIRGFACGVFDLYHPGHVLMLEECKRNCDHLTIAINRALEFDGRINPGKRKPFFNPEERAIVLGSSRYVDEILFYTTEAELTHIMQTGGFDIRFLGDDYRGRPITAAQAIPQIHFVDRSHGYSTTAVIERISRQLSKGDFSE